MQGVFVRAYHLPGTSIGRAAGVPFANKGVVHGNGSYRSDVRRMKGQMCKGPGRLKTGRCGSKRQGGLPAGVKAKVGCAAKQSKTYLFFYLFYWLLACYAAPSGYGQAEHTTGPRAR